MPHSRPMPTIGNACHELWIADKSSMWRIIYGIASDAIIIIEVFEKKTRQTPDYIVEKCKRRLKEYKQVLRRGEL